MGMFDNITVSQKYDLPIDSEQQETINRHVGKTKVWQRRFQTKSLDSLLNYYEIDEHGEFWERPPKGDPVKTDITDTIEFYDYITNNKLKTDLSVTFQALVVNGKVMDMKLVEFEANDNSHRVDAQEKWQKAFDDASERRKKLSWKLYNWLYAKHVNWCLRKLHELGQQLSSNALNSWRRRLLFWD